MSPFLTCEEAVCILFLLPFACSLCCGQYGDKGVVCLANKVEVFRDTDQCLHNAAALSSVMVQSCGQSCGLALVNTVGITKT